MVGLSDGKSIALCDGDNLEVLKVVGNPFSEQELITNIIFRGKKSVVMYAQT